MKRKERSVKRMQNPHSSFVKSVSKQKKRHLHWTLYKTAIKRTKWSIHYYLHKGNILDHREYPCGLFIQPSTVKFMTYTCSWVYQSTLLLKTWYVQCNMQSAIHLYYSFFYKQMQTKCNKVDAYIQNHFAPLKEATASANKTKNERKKRKNRDVMTAGHLECCFCNAYSTLLW